MSKHKHYRAFLEPSRRAVDSYVHVDISDGWVNLKVADCGHSINLGFDTDGRRKGVMLNKIAKLEKALALVREAVEAGGAKNLVEKP